MSLPIGTTANRGVTRLVKLLLVPLVVVPVLLGTAGAASAATTGYYITIHTANVPYAGTDGDVWVYLEGVSGGRATWTPKIGPLDDSADNFERNRTDRFLRASSEVGSLRRVRLCFNSRGGANAEWRPDTMTVNGVSFRIPAGTWYLKSPYDQCKTFSRI